MTDVTLRAGEARVTVSPANGGRLTSLRVGDLELLGGAGPGLVEWGCYPMTPYAGRIRRGRLQWQGRGHQLPLLMPPHAIHGDVLDRAWTLDAAGVATASLGCAFDARWPWAGHTVQHVRLDAGGLDLTLEVHADDLPMPAWCGWHPWFRRHVGRGGRARLELSAAAQFAKDDEGIPTGALVPPAPGPWDDCFDDVAWPAAVVWDGALRLEITSDARCAVLFDHRELAVCLEPQTAPPDAVALGRHAVVAPGSPLVATTRWTWSPA